jgi:hypothetical protein
MIYFSSSCFRAMGVHLFPLFVARVGRRAALRADLRALEFFAIVSNLGWGVTSAFCAQQKATSVRLTFSLRKQPSPEMFWRQI